MACLINNGLARDCGFSFGGIQNLYLAPVDDVTGITSNASGLITGITTSGGSPVFYSYEVEPNTGQLLQELQTGSASRFVNLTINGQFANITQAKKDVLDDLANALVVAIVQDQSGLYWYAGQTGRGLLATALTIDTGLADADAYVANISLVGGSLGFANQVDSTIIAALLV